MLRALLNTNLFKRDLFGQSSQMQVKIQENCTRIDIGSLDIAFVNGSGDQSSIPGRVIPKTQKVVLDAALLSTQHYQVQIKGKVELSWIRSCVLLYTSV